MRWLVRCLSARVGIRNRGVAVSRCSDATVVILRVGFRPLPKSAHLAVYRNAHVRRSSSERFLRISHRGGASLTAAAVALCLIYISLEGLIGRECHDHQDDKNRYDKGWNKPGCHGCCPFTKNSSVASTGAALRCFAALQSPAKRFAFESCAGVK